MNVVQKNSYRRFKLGDKAEERYCRKAIWQLIFLNFLSDIIKERKISLSFHRLLSFKIHLKVPRHYMRENISALFAT